MIVLIVLGFLSMPNGPPQVQTLAIGRSLAKSRRASIALFAALVLALVAACTTRDFDPFPVRDSSASTAGFASAGEAMSVLACAPEFD